jgi:hypothetical protein
MLHKLKIAALLAVLDGRLEVIDDDWRLARQVWATSTLVRASVISILARQKAAEETVRVERHANRELAAEAARQSAPATVERMAGRLARYVHDGPEAGQATRDLLHRLRSGERVLFEPALNHALTVGWITEIDGRYCAGESMPA